MVEAVVAMSRVEALAWTLYDAYRAWNLVESGQATPVWDHLRRDTRDEFLKLAEHLTLEDR